MARSNTTPFNLTDIDGFITGNERWQSCPGYSGYYASSQGRIASFIGTPKIRKAQAAGYTRSCTLRVRNDHGEFDTVSLARLVYSAFNGEVPRHKLVVFIDPEAGERRFHIDNLKAVSRRK